MNPIDTSRVPEYLESRRWFGGKGLPIKVVQVMEQALIPRAGHDGDAFSLLVLEVHYALGRAERYLAALTSGPNGELIEALDDDELARALLTLIREQKTLPTGGGTLRGEFLGDGGALKEVGAQPRVRRISAEQTNTSMVFDDKVILKLIRQIDLGYNPEWEMGRFLQKHGFKFTPRMLGGIVLEGTVHSTVAVAHEFVKVDSDGWDWTVEQLKRATDAQPDFLDEVRKLGACLGELHRVLTLETEDAAFSPEPIGREDLERWASSIIGELGVTAAAAAERVPDLRRRHEELVERINRLTAIDPSGMKIRTHGDLHLGQTLRSNGGWLIFDFEGEPIRSYAQRREKQSPLRDVAGMLRSFAYACAKVEMGGAPEGKRMGPTRGAFLEGYRSTATAPGLLPSDPKAFDVMLETLEIEKLLYEIRYELSHRPDWVRIPARTLLA